MVPETTTLVESEFDSATEPDGSKLAVVISIREQSEW